LVRGIARSFPGLQVYGIDLSEDMIGLARAHARREQPEERVQFACGNVAHLPYADQTFDVVVSTISLHHWAELEQPLRELYRVLRPGGWVWIYDFRFVKVQTLEQAKALTPFAATSLEQRLVRTGRSPLAFYRRFAFQKKAQSELQNG
jgi:ubiquinone/menaquinone biosynthesis C-methylase UbiE